MTMENKNKRALDNEQPSTPIHGSDNKKKDTKHTPDKTKMEGIGQVQTILPAAEVSEFRYGTRDWCAAEGYCRVHEEEANEEFDCGKCKHYTHQVCLFIPEEVQDGNEEGYFCLRCNSEQKMHAATDTSLIEQHEQHFLDMSQDIINDNDITMTQNTSQIEFTKDNEVSFLVTTSFQEEITTMLTSKWLSRDSDTRQIQAIANMAGLPVAISHTSQSIKDKLVNDMCKVLTSDEYNRFHLYSNRYKTLARFAKISLPKGKMNRKKKDHIIDMCLDQISTNVKGSSDIDSLYITDMTKLTGIFLPNYCIIPAAADKILQDATKWLKSLNTIDKEFKYDAYSHQINKITLKEFQIHQEEKNKDTMDVDDKAEHGTKHWCAYGKFCRNRQYPATNSLKCGKCLIASHKECGRLHEEHFNCFLCVNSIGGTPLAANITVNTSLPKILQTVPKAKTTSTIATSLFTNKREGSFWSTRLEIRINVPPTTFPQNSVEKLYNLIVEMIKELRKSDPSIQVAPWAEKDSNEVCMSMKKNYMSLQELHKYVPRVQNMEQGTTWGDIRLLHKKSYTDILYDTGIWLKNHGYGLFFKELQAETILNVGWMLFSFRTIDAKVLSRELFKLYGIEVAFRYSLIAVDNNPSKVENQVRALHIVAPAGRPYDKAKEVMQEVYSSVAVNFPLGIPLRFIPTAARVGRDRILKIKILKQYQKDFGKAIEKNLGKSWEVLNLDEPSGTMPSLRSVIMSTKSMVEPATNLFVSADVAYNNSELVLFSYLPRFEDEARFFVSNLVPYILNTHGDEYATYFTRDAISRSKDTEWDAEKREVISKDDKWIDSFDNLDFDWLGIPKSDHKVVLSMDSAFETASTGKIERIYLREEADSVGTISSRNRGVGLPSIGEKKVYEPTSQHISSSLTIGSGQSEGTRLSVVENSIFQIQQDGKDLKASIEALTLLITNNNTNNTKTNDEYGSPGSQGSGSE